MVLIHCWIIHPSKTNTQKGRPALAHTQTHKQLFVRLRQNLHPKHKQKAQKSAHVTAAQQSAAMQTTLCGAEATPPHSVGQQTIAIIRLENWARKEKKTIAKSWCQTLTGLRCCKAEGLQTFNQFKSFPASIHPHTHSLVILSSMGKNKEGGKVESGACEFGRTWRVC